MKASSGLGLRWSFVAILGAMLLAGCGGGDAEMKPVAKVTGKVTADGQAVSGGTLIFSPIAEEKDSKPGKAGNATIKPDGTFVVTTYTDGDGAVMGKHRILFSAAAPAPAAGSAHSEVPAVSPFAGLVPKTPEVAIYKGGNEINIELVKQEVVSPQK